MRSARQLGRRFRRTHDWVVHYRASEVALYNDASAVIDVSFFGGVIYLLTFAPLIMALLTLGLASIVKLLYYVGHGISTEVGMFSDKFAARLMLTINTIVLAAAITLITVSNSMFKSKASTVLLVMLLVETASVLTWYRKWALRDQERNMQDLDYGNVTHRTGVRYLIGALFVFVETAAFIFLA
jgi:hypothetical protein